MLEHAHGEELRCEGCGGELIVVCKKNRCDDPLETRRKAKGPVPVAPAKPERRKAKHQGRVCKCGNPLPRYKQSCAQCQAERGRKAPANPRKPIAETKICRVCKSEKPVGEFDVVYAHYRRADCRTCRKEERRKAKAVSV